MKGSRRFALFLLLAGIFILLYPALANRRYELSRNRELRTYETQMETLPEQAAAKMMEAARKYQKSGSGERYDALLDPLGTGMMGILEIPAIRCRLPIYHGTREAVLEKGVGHLPASSLPVGGTGSHCILSGHRGLPTAKLFTDLDKVKLGDVFTLYVLEERLTYRVDQIITVTPRETEALEIREGEDLCTLITCTPYGINSHRLLVRGVRVEDP